MLLPIAFYKKGSIIVDVDRANPKGEKKMLELITAVFTVMALVGCTSMAVLAVAHEELDVEWIDDLYYKVWR